jgi:hypothetical protein
MDYLEMSLDGEDFKDFSVVAIGQLVILLNHLVI